MVRAVQTAVGIAGLTAMIMAGTVVLIATTVTGAADQVVTTGVAVGVAIAVTAAAMDATATATVTVAATTDVAKSDTL